MLRPSVNGGLSPPAAVESEPEPAPESTPAVTDRWCHTSDGFKVPSLMRLTQTGMFHRGYLRPPQDMPPSVKVGMLVACRPIDPPASGSELRAKFISFLNSEPVRQFVGALTHVARDASWKNLAGHGPRTLKAALTAGEDPMEGGTGSFGAIPAPHGRRGPLRPRRTVSHSYPLRRAADG